MIARAVVFLLLAATLPALVGTAEADEWRVRRHARAPHWDVPRHVHLPPERHVIEVVHHRGFFIVNGARFTPTAPHCLNWVAGDRVRFLAGELHGACATALIYNATTRQVCEVRCN